MDEKDLDELIKETQRRQRKKTDLSAYEAKLKEMLDLDISLPVILDWIFKEEKDKKYTTLPALRRYVVRTFGESFYHDFMKRNGWLKIKSKITSQHNPIPGRKEGEQNQENTQPAGADLDESKDLVEAPEGTEPKKPSSGKRKILTRKDLRNAKQSGSEETDQFINK